MFVDASFSVSSEIIGVNRGETASGRLYTSSWNIGVRIW